ncbi:MAG TPA: ABC transporter permease, partial [Candidatus Limnocylindria bacterium]|nr:ABC transporter permease [Candidatus Limnocylindria bacterium]
MSWRRTLAITRRLLSQFRHDHRTVALLLVAPIVLLGLFALLFRSDGQPPTIGVIESDSGPLGDAVVEQLRGSELVTLRGADEGSQDMEAALDEGEMAGYVVFPETFSQRAMSEGVIAPVLRLRGTDPAASGAVTRAIGTASLAALDDLLPPGSNVGPPRLELEPSFLFGGEELDTLDQLGGPFIGLVVFFLVYVVTSVSFL